MARFVEEEGMEKEEKVEGVRGMLEGMVEGVSHEAIHISLAQAGHQGEFPSEGVDEAVGKVIDEWGRLQDEEAKRKAEEEAERRSLHFPAPMTHLARQIPYTPT